jgi:hypothetical protein
LILALLLLPMLATAKTAGMSSTEDAVSVLDRRVVGVFDTTTLASQDPKALQTWLSANGFTLPAEATPAIESYVKEGWVFVTAKIRRERSDLRTSTPHPLSFTFKTARPVYPMRLTGVNNGPLRVELYVFGPERASAPHFNVERCSLPRYPSPREQWSRISSEPPNIVHPLLRQWVAGSPLATKLTATLNPADMRQDVWIGWRGFRQKDNVQFSRSGALTYSLNRGVGLFAALLFLAFIVADLSRNVRRDLDKLAAGAAIVGAALTGILYLSLHKTEVRVARAPGRTAELNLRYATFELEAGTNVTLATARAILSDFVASIGGPDPARRSLSNVVVNPLLGGTVHEEDSPGNYTLRETATGLEFVAYDAQGAEHVLSRLPRQVP